MTISARPLPAMQAPPAALKSNLSIWTWAMLAAALTASAGSLWLSLGMKLKACPLCFYQRSFALAAAAVLLMALITRAYRATALGLLVAPLAFAGLWVAIFHVMLDVTGKLECPDGIFGVGSAPLQSLIILALLAGLAATDATRGWTAWVALVPLIVAVALGIAMGQACMMSTPPPLKPAKPYDTPIDGCRVPYPAPGS